MRRGAGVASMVGTSRTHRLVIVARRPGLEYLLTEVKA